MDGGAQSLDKTINNRVTLRFRPIAPKPIAGAPVLDHRSTVLLSGKRSKRKYVRVRHHNTTKDLQHQRRRDDGSSVAAWCKRFNRDPTAAGKTEIHEDQVVVKVDDGGKMVDRTVRVVDTWVTVESVTGSCMMELGRRTDDEKVMRNLEHDTCPAFVSDGLNRLRWVNRAYRKMVVREEEEEVMVWLKIEDMEVYSRTAFSCKVKLLFYDGNQNGSPKCTKVVPCDAWRMDTGGFAWRLDVNAALTLGL